MKTSDLDYELPERLIAQHPLEMRDQSRLMVLRRDARSIEHHRFAELPALLRAGDLLVCNDTRVVPAKFSARRATGAFIEGLFLRELSPGRWEVMLTRSRRIKIGERLQLGETPYGLVLESSGGPGLWHARLDPSAETQAVLDAVGVTPLPPYIRRDPADRQTDAEDRQRYQTVFASRPGAVAAPTAGLHFTDALLARLDAAGIKRAMLTLHVGLGTFQPVNVDQLADHRMHSEWFELPAETAAACNETRAAGGRVVAVGTTGVRVLETCADDTGALRPQTGTSNLFIYPPYRFKAVDAVLTNFHLPRSTLLALVFAFAGREFVLKAYRQAVAFEYRFYSYGDAMLIL
jgi:S-adenosylmethionine:tRNA ribosyltransferase-isomerase